MHRILRQTKCSKICYKQFGKIEETSVHFESHCSFYSFQFKYKNSKMVLPLQKQKLLDVLTYVFSFDRNAKMQDAEFLSICKWMTWWASQSYDLFFRVEVSNILKFSTRSPTELHHPFPNHRFQIQARKQNLGPHGDDSSRMQNQFRCMSAWVTCMTIQRF